MTPSIDERREVALSLRYLANVELRGSDDVVGFIEALDDELFDFGPNPMSDFALRLADLIEPSPERTCRMIDNGVELCCSACDRRHGYDDEPAFCMGCGAKVVEP